MAVSEAYNLTAIFTVGNKTPNIFSILFWIGYFSMKLIEASLHKNSLNSGTERRESYDLSAISSIIVCFDKLKHK